MWAMVLMCALMGMIVVSSAALQHVSTWRAMSGWIATLRPAFIVLHLALITALWFRWSDLVHWGFRKGWILADHLRLMLGLRPRVMAMLVLLEVVLVIRPLEWL